MKTMMRWGWLALVLALAGCSTSQSVTLVKGTPPPVAVVSQVADAGNSPEMDAFLKEALQAQSLEVRGTVLPAGTTRAEGVDALVSYVDVWRWDLAMYLASVSVKMHDARSGDLLVMGEWKDSPLHGFRDAKVVLAGLVQEMLAKLRGAAPAAK